MQNDAPRLPSQSQLFQMPNSIWIFQHQDLSECVLSAGMVIGVRVCNRPCMDSFVYWSTGGHICIPFACHFTMKKRLSPWSLQWSGLCRISCSFPCHLNLKKTCCSLRKICTNVTKGGLPEGAVLWRLASILWNGPKIHTHRTFFTPLRHCWGHSVPIWFHTVEWDAGELCAASHIAAIQCI